MINKVKKAVSQVPILGEIVANIKRATAENLSWAKEKRLILKDASKLFFENYSLDVSKRYGFYLFHNRNNSLIKRKEYEPEVQKALIMLINISKLRNTKTVFADIGANIGLHTLFLKSKYTDLEVIAFDPSPFSWKYLELTLKYNNIQNVSVRKIGLYDQNGVFDFYNWSEESSADSFRDTKRVFGVKPNIIKVSTKRLDDITDVPAISVIKMDCEGSELLILKGAKSTIKETNPFILLEFHPVNRKAYGVTNEDIFDLLTELDYCLYSLDFEILDIGKFEAFQQRFEENYLMLPNKLFGMFLQRENH